MAKRSNIGGNNPNPNTRKPTNPKRSNPGARRGVLLLGVVSGLALWSSAASRAQGQISVANYNFANPSGLTVGMDQPSGNFPGWTILGGFASVFAPDPTTQFTGPLDSGLPNVLAVNNGANLYQNLGTMIVGQTYNFNISYGWRTDVYNAGLQDTQFQFTLRPTIYSGNAEVISQSQGWNYGGPTNAVVTTAPQPTAPSVLQHDILSYTATAADNGQPLALQIYIGPTQNTTQLDINQILLTTTSAPVDPTQLFYTGNVSGAFDSMAADNFALSNGSSAQFTNDGTKTVTFNDTRIDNGSNVSNTSIVIQKGGVLPAAVNVATNNINYTFTDLDGTHGIGGSALLVKTGTSTLFLNGSNSYTGGTNISAGAVSVGTNNALGTGLINFTSQATLLAGASVTLNNAMSLGSSETTFNTSGNTLTLTGAISNTPTPGTIIVPVMNVIGTGTLNLAGSLNVSSQNNDGNNPALYMASTGTTVNITGTGTLSSISMAWIGSTNVLTLNPAGTLNMTNTDGSLDVGQQGGSGAVFQTGGTVTMAGNFNIARWDSSYASYNMTGGTLNVVNLNIGGYGTGTQFGGTTNTVFTQSGGTINVTGNTLLVVQNAGLSTAYLTAGAYNNTGSIMLANGSGANASLTVTGTSALSSGSILLGNNSNAASISVLNLNGGTTTTGKIQGANATPTSIVNFNGGTLVASGSNIAFMGGLTAANIYSGGAIIDSGSNAITVSQNLSSAGGSGGLNAPATVSTAGSGYISPPVVTVLGGGGVGATAVATVSGGVVTGITITNPGTGYTSTPTFNVAGGGGTGAAFTAPAPTTNAADGGLIKRGGGTLTLSGSNTYHGATQILAGTLQVAGPGPSVPIVNANFTYAKLSIGYQYGSQGLSEPAGGWTYVDTGGNPEGAGVIDGTNGFLTTGAIPNNSQAAFIQRMGAIQQTLTFPTTGNYSLSFYTEQRAGNTGQALDVYLDDPNNGGLDVMPGGVTSPISWTLETFTFNETAGSHLLTIQGLNPPGGDNTAYVTDVALTAPYVGGSATNGIPDASAVVVSPGATLDINNSIETIGSLSSTSTTSSVLLGTGTLTVGGDGTSTNFAGTISGAGSLVKIGSGVQTLSGSNSYGGSTNVSAGTLVIANHGALPAGTPVAVGRSGVLVLDSQSTETGITSLNLNGSLIVHGGSFSAINSAVGAGFNGGAWNGSGAGAISSSSAAGDASRLTGLGVIQNSLNGLTTGAVLDSSFEGQTGLTSSDVLVKLTYYGDTNLDGKVDGTDYSRVDNGFLQHLTGWFNGDFNYDGAVNGSDYTLLDNAYNSQGAAISAEVAAPTAQVAGTFVVPEPATMGILAIGAAGFLGRRRRRH